MKKHILSFALCTLIFSGVFATGVHHYEYTYASEDSRSLNSWINKASKQCPIKLWDSIKITSVSSDNEIPKLVIVTSLSSRRFRYVENNKQKYSETFIRNIAESYKSRGNGEGDKIGALSVYRLLEESIRQQKSVYFVFYSSDKSQKSEIKLRYGEVKRALKE